MYDDERYEVIMGSDVDRDGMILELRLRSSPSEVASWAFYSDADGSFDFERHRDAPPEVEAWFDREANRRLPPVPDA